MSLMRWLPSLALLLPGIAVAASLQVASSAPPVDFLVRQIGGNRVQSTVLIKPGRNPENDEPSPGQMKHIARASLWFRIGLPFEQRWQPVLRSINPALREINLADAPAARPQDTAQQHGHRHRDIDPHIWTDPVKMRIAAEKVHQALVKADPANAADYHRNARDLTRRLDQLHADTAQLLAPFRGRAFLVYHPAWGHFAKRYGLRQIAMERDGKTPGPRYLTELASLARKENIHTIFVQKQFDRSNAETLARAIGAKIVELDPLSADYLNNMRATARAITASMQ